MLWHWYIWTLFFLHICCSCAGEHAVGLWWTDKAKAKNASNVLSYNPECTLTGWLACRQTHVCYRQWKQNKNRQQKWVTGHVMFCFSVLSHFFNTFCIEFHLKDKAVAPQYVCHTFFINKSQEKTKTDKMFLHLSILSHILTM